TVEQEFRAGTQTVHYIAFSPNNELLASSGHDSSLRLWPLTQQVLRTDNPVRRVVQSQDGEWLVSGEGSGTVRLWNSTQQEGKVLYTHGGPVSALDICRAEPVIASASRDGTVFVYGENLGKGKTLAAEEAIVHLLFAPDCSALAVATADDILIWNLVSG